MKKILGIVFSICLVFVLVACGVSTTTPKKTEPSPIQSNTKTTTSSVSETKESKTSTFTSVTSTTKKPTTTVTEVKQIDYVNELKLDESRIAGKAFLTDGIGLVTLHQSVDGDTIHVKANGYVIQIRFFGVNTPESTGKIQPWGHAASVFTSSKVSKAKTIVLEASTTSGAPETDTTGNRYLAFVWYDLGDGNGYRNLNLELVQNAYSKSTIANADKYGTYFMGADAQASKTKAMVWGNDIDPDFYYGDAIGVSIKDLRENPNAYYGKKVYFEGTVVKGQNQDFYVQDDIEDEETGLTTTYGIYIFTQYHDITIARVGNRLKIIGVFSLYDVTGAYQIVDVSFNEFAPEENDITLLAKKQPYTITEIEDASELNIANIAIENTLVHLTNVTVGSNPSDVYVTEGSGAKTLTCTKDGKPVQVRIVSDLEIINPVTGVKMTDADFLGATFDITGVVGRYNGAYQILLLSKTNIEIK